jgi:hypothetical protein
MEKHFMLLSLTLSTLLLAPPAGAKELPVPPGEFDLGPGPHEPVDLSCSVHLSLSNTPNYPTATLAESVSGCEQAVERFPRLYGLALQSTNECNSSTYTGFMLIPWFYPDPPPRSLVLIDHREDTCNNLPARVIVEEKFDGVTTTLYAGDPVPITVSGALAARPVLCGTETTGFGIVTEEKGTFELFFHGGEQDQFEEGSVAWVVGERTLLQGLCTQDRPAIDVTDMLVCPSSGSVDCMPPSPKPKLCTPDAQEWVSANCPGVSYTF